MLPELTSSKKDDSTSSLQMAVKLSIVFMGLPLQAILSCMGDGLVRDSGVLVVLLTVAITLVVTLGNSSTSQYFSIYSHTTLVLWRGCQYSTSIMQSKKKSVRIYSFIKNLFMYS